MYINNMKAHEIINLVKLGAELQARTHLKKLTIHERMKTLHDLIPYVKVNPKSLSFFHRNFSVEIGALISAEYDYNAAERLYNSAKAENRFTP